MKSLARLIFFGLVLAFCTLGGTYACEGEFIYDDAGPFSDAYFS